MDTYYKWEVVFQRSKPGSKTTGGLMTMTIKIPFGQSSAADAIKTAEGMLQEEIGIDPAAKFNVIAAHDIEAMIRHKENR